VCKRKHFMVFFVCVNVNLFNMVISVKCHCIGIVRISTSLEL